MANRFWVGGTATWDVTAGTKWSTTSGGGGGASVPVSSDAAIFDSNSGSGSVTCSAGSIACGSLTTTGFTGTLTTGNIQTIGNVTIGSGTTISGVNLSITGSGTCSLTTNGKTFTDITLEEGESCSLSLQDALTCTGDITFNSTGTFATNGFDVSAVSFASELGTRTINLGASTVTLTGNAGWSALNPTLTVTAGTSTIKLTGASPTFDGDGETYYNLWLNHSTTATIIGSNTFNDLKIDVANSTTRFTAGTTTTVASTTISGSGTSNKVTLKSVTDTSAWTISDSSGLNTVTYCSIRDSTATGGATFNAAYSTNVSGNSGWNFVAPGRGMIMVF